VPTSPRGRTREREFAERHPTLTRVTDAVEAVVCAAAAIVWLPAETVTAAWTGGLAVLLVVGTAWPRFGVVELLPGPRRWFP
jgi:hypothetical protein